MGLFYLRVVRARQVTSGISYCIHDGRKQQSIYEESIGNSPVMVDDRPDKIIVTNHMIGNVSDNARGAQQCFSL